MPTYCYKCDFCNRTQDAFRTVAQRNRRLPCECGKRMVRDCATEMGAIKVPVPGNWPMESYAMGCNPNEVAKMEAHSREVGVPTTFNKITGDAEIHDQTHYTKYAKAIGLFHRNAGYSDPTPS